MQTPTQTSYSELQAAYKLLNKHLFDDKLPDCLITLQPRGRRVYGFYAAQRFSDGRGAVTDELALNPAHFHSLPIEQVLQTLGHEMVHAWQAHFGSPGRRGYHNKQWAAKMKEIGLYPSHTGEPGGDETGEHMSDYLIEGGAIAGVIRTLLTDGFRLSWAEQQPARMSGISDHAGDDEGEGSGKLGNRTNRVKYTCPGCGIMAWGKPRLTLVCGACMAPLAAVAA